MRHPETVAYTNNLKQISKTDYEVTPILNIMPVLFQPNEFSVIVKLENQDLGAEY
jgi:hypothetical protein